MMIWQSGPDARPHYFNEEWLRFTGRTLAEELGNGGATNVHPEDLGRRLSIYRDNFKLRAPFEANYRLRRHDNVFRMVKDHAVPLFDEGRFLGYFGACFDLEAQHEEGRQRAELTSNVAHDLRQPLSTLMLLVERMRRGIREGGAPSNTHFAQLRTQIDRCTRLVEDLADTSVVELGRPLMLCIDHVALTEMLEDLVGVFDAREQGRREPQCHYFVITQREEIHLERGDRRRMERVFVNLLENARKYSPRGGTIEVQLHQDDAWVEVRISDPGMGMTSDTLLQLTRRFFRSAETGSIPGFGLGLSISREIVEAHGGDLTFESRPGEGTTVTVRLPRDGMPLRL